MSQFDDLAAAKALTMRLDGIDRDMLGRPAPTYDEMVQAFAGYELHLIDPDGEHALTIRHDVMKATFVVDTPGFDIETGSGA